MSGDEGFLDDHAAILHNECALTCGKGRSVQH